MRRNYGQPYRSREKTPKKFWGFPGSTSGKNPPACARDMRDTGLIPGSGRSSGEGNGNPLQYSCLENPMDRGAWRATQSMELQRVGYN